MLGVLPEDSSEVEEGDLLVTGGDEVLVHVAVGVAGLCELKLFLGVNDEVGGGTYLAHHGLGTVEHVGVLCVGLEDAGRYAVYLAQLAPAAEGELLHQDVWDGLVEDAKVETIGAELKYPLAEVGVPVAGDTLVRGTSSMSGSPTLSNVNWTRLWL